MEEPTHFSLLLETSGTDLQSDISAFALDPTVHPPLDALETLPERYNRDRLQLMVQSPFRVFAYWEVTPERLQKALAPFPKEEHHSFRMILRWIEIGQDPHQAFDSGAASEWWFATRPGSRYQAELCLHSEIYGAIPVFTSNEVETPSDSIAQTALEKEECAETTRLLSRLVELTGLKQELRQADTPMQIVEPGARFGDQINSERKKELTPKELRKDTSRPTSFFW